MRKTFLKKLAWVTAAVSFLICTLCGCAESEVLMKYDNQIHSDNSFDANLFYRNDLEVSCADPFVLTVTDKESTEYGYFYLYGTNATNGFVTYRSKNLDKWEDLFTIKGFQALTRDMNDFKSSSFWAPEVVYDETVDKYYMFYSADALYMGESATSRYIFCAVADEPYGPFEPLIDANHSSGKVPFFDIEAAANAMTNAKDGYNTEYPHAIDPHPFIDPATGEKYLYFTPERNGYSNGAQIWCCKMHSWTEPNYSSFTKLTDAGYKTVGNRTDANVNDCEKNSHVINSTNEGGAIIPRKQKDGSYKYYLTMSINSWRDKSYSVIQAVGNSPMGPFTKLSVADGGIILGTNFSLFDHVSGTGHHSFVTVGGETYIVYHAHIDRTLGNSSRNVAFDKVEFVKNSKGEEVLYVNGPTWSLQPKVAACSGYVNLAKQATVKTSAGENVSSLNDGLLTVYDYLDYVTDFRATETVTITLTFDDYREISAIMVYNGLNYEETFVDIARIELDFADESKDYQGTAVIKNLEFNWDFYKQAFLDYMRPGGSAIAVFNPIKVKEIRIKIEVPTKRPENIEIVDEFGRLFKQEAISVSEIVVLGRG